MQSHLLVSASPSILHAGHTPSCDRGNLLEKGQMDGQWRWECVAQVCFIWVSSWPCQPNASNTNEPRQDIRSQMFFAFFSCTSNHAFFPFTSPLSLGVASQRARIEKRPDPGDMGEQLSLRPHFVRRCWGGSEFFLPAPKCLYPTGIQWSEWKRTGRLITAIVCQLAAIPACQLAELFSDSSAFL